MDECNEYCDFPTRCCDWEGRAHLVCEYHAETVTVDGEEFIVCPACARKIRLAKQQEAAALRAGIATIEKALRFP